MRVSHQNPNRSLNSKPNHPLNFNPNRIPDRYGQWRGHWAWNQTANSRYVGVYNNCGMMIRCIAEWIAEISQPLWSFFWAEWGKVLPESERNPNPNPTPKLNSYYFSKLFMRYPPTLFGPEVESLKTFEVTHQWPKFYNSYELANVMTLITTHKFLMNRYYS